METSAHANAFSISGTNIRECDWSTNQVAEKRIVFESEIATAQWLALVSRDKIRANALENLDQFLNNNQQQK